MIKITEAYLTPTYNDEDNTRSMIDRYDTLGSTIHYTGNPGTTARGNRNYFNVGHDVNSTFILDDDDCLQCLPWNERPWTNGHSSNGWSVTTEVCHPDSTGKFTDTTYNRLVELQALICKKYGLNPLSQLYRHCDFINTDCPGYLARNNEAWDQFKKDVKSFMENGKVEHSTITEVTNSVPTQKTIAQLAQEVLNGVHGNGDERRNSLGDKYDVVQAEVNRILNTPTANVKPTYDITNIAREVIAGKYGNGEQRRIALENLGLSYNDVQDEVNRLLDGDVEVSSTTQSRTSVKWTNATKSNGVDATVGENCITTDALNARYWPTTKAGARFILPEGHQIKVIEDAGKSDGISWLKVTYRGPSDYNGVDYSDTLYTDYVASRYLR